MKKKAKLSITQKAEEYALDEIKRKIKENPALSGGLNPEKGGKDAGDIEE